MNELSKMSSDAHADVAIHQKWVANYRTAEMQAFYDMAFDRIAEYLQVPPRSMILDAGCGSCAKSVFLAARGFHVTACDYSSDALSLAKETVQAQGCADRITLQQEDLTGLSFSNGSFQHVLCWGGIDAHSGFAASSERAGQSGEAGRHARLKRRECVFPSGCGLRRFSGWK